MSRLKYNVDGLAYVTHHDAAIVMTQQEAEQHCMAHAPVPPLPQQSLAPGPALTPWGYNPASAIGSSFAISDYWSNTEAAIFVERSVREKEVVFELAYQVAFWTGGFLTRAQQPASAGAVPYWQQPIFEPVRMPPGSEVDVSVSGLP